MRTRAFVGAATTLWEKYLIIKYTQSLLLFELCRYRHSGKFSTEQSFSIGCFSKIFYYSPCLYTWNKPMAFVLLPCIVFGGNQCALRTTKCSNLFMWAEILRFSCSQSCSYCRCRCCCWSFVWSELSSSNAVSLHGWIWSFFIATSCIVYSTFRTSNMAGAEIGIFEIERSRAANGNRQWEFQEEEEKKRSSALKI